MLGKMLLQFMHALTFRNKKLKTQEGGVLKTEKKTSNNNYVS